MKVTSFALTLALSVAAASAASTAPASLQISEGSDLRKRWFWSSSTEQEKEESLQKIAYRRFSKKVDKKIASLGGSANDINECMKGGMSLYNCSKLQLARKITPVTNEPTGFLGKMKASIMKTFRKEEKPQPIFERLFGKDHVKLPSAPQKASDKVKSKSSQSSLFDKVSDLLKEPSAYMTGEAIFDQAESDFPAKLKELKTPWFGSKVVPKPTSVVTLFDYVQIEAHKSKITVDEFKAVAPKILDAFNIDVPEFLERNLRDVARQYFGEGEEKLRWTAFRSRFLRLVRHMRAGKLRNVEGNIWDMKLSAVIQ